MDATRTRRTKDPARQRWYAQERQRRFARFLNFGSETVGASTSDANAPRVSTELAESRDAQPKRDRANSLTALAGNYFENLLLAASANLGAAIA